MKLVFQGFLPEFEAERIRIPWNQFSECMVEKCVY